MGIQFWGLASTISRTSVVSGGIATPPSNHSQPSPVPSPTSVVSGGIAIGGVLLLSLLPSLSQWLARYTPGALSSYEVKLVSGTAAFSDAVPALVITISLVVLLVAITVMVFQRQEL
ncbi:MAG: hypothetical protein RQM95_03065 [Syntrophaceticus schinkii]